jgi:hypothetical protein
MLTYEAHARADPAVAWALMARPDRWSAWAPHLRGAWGLGDPEVREGARGAARLLGAIPVPAHVSAVDPGRSWTWQVGPARLHHRIRPRADGICVVGVDLVAPLPLEAALALSYGPLVDLLVRNLARAAERAG